MLKGKRSRVFIALIPISAFFLVFYALHISIPSPKSPILFYSSHQRDDLRLTLLKVIKKAKLSIDIHTYSLTDPHVLSLLNKKAKAGVDVHVTYHEKLAPRLKYLEKPHLHLHPVKGKGLMHAKWLVIDRSIVFLGTANLTTSSLSMHDNFLIGFYAPDLAKALANPPPFFQTQINGQTLSFFLLPGEAALPRLLHALEKAKKEVSIAMFTLTHPQIVDTLVKCGERGVKVKLYLDQLSARGASKGAIKQLLKGGLHPKESQGLQLFHHKWAMIDCSTFILGSANWTQAAFKKNKDFIIFLSPLKKHQIKYLNKTNCIINKDCNLLLNNL